MSQIKCFSGPLILSTTVLSMLSHVVVKTPKNTEKVAKFVISLSLERKGC